jgi:transcriptional regulator with XRE-family HTH domain
MTISSLWKKFRSRKYRHAFVEAQLKRGVPTQMRAMRLKRGWTQKELAQRCGLEQGTISRIENPDYGQLTFDTVLAVARGFDCAFIGRYVPFSQLRALVENSSEEEDDLAPSFEQEDAALKDGTRLEVARGSRSVAGVDRHGLRQLVPPATSIDKAA